MKRTILVCDCCKLPVPAVKSVDLCRTHLELMHQLGQKKQKRHEKIKKVWNEVDYTAVLPKIMDIAESRPFFTAQRVVRDLQVSKYVAMIACRKLIAEGKLDSTGKGAGRKLSKAS